MDIAGSNVLSTGSNVADNKNEIRCPKCESSIFVDANQAGEKIGCPRCRNVVLVPGQKPKANKNVSVDDLIDIDDDILHANSDGNEIVAKSVDHAMPVDAKPVDLVNDLPEELQLAPADDTPFNHDDDEAEPAKPAEPVGKKVDPDDDLGDLINIPVSEPINEAEDPFEVDENADLVVEGVTPHDGQFGVTCNLCGSLLYARVSQVGSKIKCHDCYSLVEVPPPRVKPKPVEEFTPVDDDAGQGGYNLSEPYELETIDTTVDITLGEINYDDDDFFEKKRKLEGKTDSKLVPIEDDEPISIEDAIDDSDDIKVIEDSVGGSKDKDVVLTAKVVPEPVADDDEDEGYSLLPVPDDLPDVRPTTNFKQTTNISDPISIDSDPVPEKITQSRKTSPARKSVSPGANRDVPLNAAIPAASTSDAADAGNSAKRADSPESESEAANNASKTKTRVAKDGLDYSSAFGNFGAWFQDGLKPLKNINGAIKVALAALAIGACYMFISWGASFFTPEYNNLEKFGGFILALLGAIPLALFLFVMGVIANSIVQIAITQEGELSEWPDFSLVDWLSQFLYLGTSFWIAAIPGAILGSIAMFVTDESIWLYSIILISSMVLAPMFLCSVVFNESPVAFVSPDVYKSFRSMRNRWIRFATIAFAFALMISLSTLLIQFSVVFGFIVAGFQIVLLTIYWWFLGDLVGHVVRWLAERKEER